MSERAVFTGIRVGLAFGGNAMLVKPIVLVPGEAHHSQVWFRAIAALLLLAVAIPYGRPPSKGESDEG